MMDSSRNPDNGTELKAIIFDLDDTLYPEIDYVRSGFSHISSFLESKYGLSRDECFRRLMDDFQKGVRGNSFNLLLDAMGIDYCREDIAGLIAEYRGHRPEIELPGQSGEILELFQKRGLKLGLLSDGFLKAQEQKIRSLQIEDRFDVILLTDSLGRDYWKPSARPFQEMLKMLGESGRHCSYVADNPEKDFRGAKECGILGVQLLHWVMRDYSLLPEEYHPDVIVDRIDQLADLIP
ncbi:MAG: HAD family hydrolase [Actinobacteria bacterium]|nr:HAD family hydrolase [Actinomycetota bacterium]